MEATGPTACPACFCPPVDPCTRDTLGHCAAITESVGDLGGCAHHASRRRHPPVRARCLRDRRLATTLVLSLDLPDRVVCRPSVVVRSADASPRTALARRRHMDRHLHPGRSLRWLPVSPVAGPLGPVRRCDYYAGKPWRAVRLVVCWRPGDHSCHQPCVASFLVRAHLSAGRAAGCGFSHSQRMASATRRHGRTQRGGRKPTTCLSPKNAACHCGGHSLGAVSRTVSGRTTPLRPPGSVDASQFSALCIRCGNCARACPTQIITHEWGEHGLLGLLTPKVEFRDEYCLESCNQCTTVCPSGAIQPVSLEEKIRTRIGIPIVNMEACLLADDRECSVCRNRCPYEAIQFEFDEQRYTLTPRVDLTRCPGCGACEVACPVEPVKAIVIEPSNSIPITARRERQSLP